MTAPALGRRALLALGAAAPAALALGRPAAGGALRIALPYGLDALDPFSGTDVASALLGPALADPLFAADGSGRIHPVLAASAPTATATGARVALRAGLATAGGRALDARDLVASLARARRGGAAPLLRALPPPRPVPGDPLALDFPGVAPAALAEALSSPAIPVVARAGGAGLPDGTGAFRARRDGDTLVLAANPRAARGMARLDELRVESARDLAGMLRAFESGAVGLVTLGAGLHAARPGARPFTAPPVGLVLLRTGTVAGRWGAPGVAAGLVEGLAPERLAHLGLSPLVTRGSSAGWGGPSGDLLVEGASAHLVEVARALCAELSRPGSELALRPVAAAELRARVESGRFLLAVTFLRLPGPRPEHVGLALGAPAGTDAVTATRTRPFAVLGALAPSGHAAPELRGLERFDLGDVYLAAGR